MAKWGEGDPRWIVEERPDATNVNNWHWTEKNACPWSQDKLKELFTGMVIQGSNYKCHVTEIEKCEGEAVANNRKGKLIFFYEWNLTLKWKLDEMDEDDGEVSGKINIPNLSEENSISEVDIEITLKDSTELGEKVKHFLHTKGKDTIRKALAEYVAGLKEEFSKGMILPKKDTVTENIKNITSGFDAKTRMNSFPETNSKSSGGGKVTATAIVKQQQKFQCRADDFVKAFTTVEMVQAFTKASARVDPRKGGKFELFDGNIQGTFIEVSRTKIVQTWRCKQWPAGHYSQVTLDISQKSDHTEVNLTQSSVPNSEAESTKDNWDRYYWDPIKRTFGFGYFM